MKKLKNKIEEQIEESNVTGFKFKVTNLRKSAYPDIHPEQSDYFGFKVGDLLSKGMNTSSKTIYEVTGIVREPIEPDGIAYYEKLLGVNTRDTKAKALLEEYKKSGNFGICRIDIKSVLRGSTVVAKGRKSSFSELSQIRIVRYNGFKHVNVSDVQSNRKYQLQRMENQITSLRTKLKNEYAVQAAFNQLVIDNGAKKAAMTIVKAEQDDEVTTLVKNATAQILQIAMIKKAAEAA